MSHSKFSGKGFVFVLEVIIAFVLFLAFLNIASVEQFPKNHYLENLSTKSQVNDIYSFFDSNGFLLEIIDTNGMGSSEKMDLIENKIVSMLPGNLSYRIKLTNYEGDPDSCQSSEEFSDCFAKLDNYPARGSSVPIDSSVFHERFFFISKEPAEQCSVSAIFAGEKCPLSKDPSPALSLSKEPFIFDPPKIFSKKISFDANNGDLNIFFGVGVTPEDEADCGENIRVDMNAYVPDYTTLFGRHPADIALVMDVSGSMDEVTVNKYQVSSGSFNGGTYSTFWGMCDDFGNWQNIGTINIDSSLEGEKLAARMYYSGYNGNCSRPRMRLRTPSGSYLPSSSGSSSSTGVPSTTNSLIDLPI